MARTAQELWAAIEESRAYKSRMVRSWDLTRSFVEGKQHLYWDSSREQFAVLEPTQTERNRTTINKMLGIYRNAQSRLSANTPGIGCLPTAANTEAIMRAMACEQACQAYLLAGRNGDNIHRKMRQFAVLWGAAWLVPRFNPKTETVESMVYSNYDAFIEKDTMEFAESDWCALRSFHVKEALLEVYPKFANEIQSACDGKREGPTATTPANRIELMNVYERSTGLHKVMIKDTVLWEGPYAYGKFPVQRAPFTDVAHVPWGVGLMFSLIDLQQQYNKGRKMLFDSVEQMANPGWLIPKFAGVKNDVDTTKPGWKMYFNPLHGKPEQADIKSLPGYVFENLNMIGTEFQDVSNIHDSAAGKRPNGIEAGVALQTLVDQDVTVLEDAMTNMEQAMAAHLEDVLRCMKFNYTQDRMIRLLSTSGGVVHRVLKTTDLEDDPQITIEAGTMFRATADRREQRVLSLMDRKLMDPQEVRNAIDFRMPGMSAAKKLAGLFHARQILEACKLIGMSPEILDVEILPTDDLEAFKLVFHEFIETPEYYLLHPEAQDTIRNVLLRVAQPNATPEQFAEQSNKKVWPVQTTSAEQMAQLAGVLGGPAGVNAAVEAQRMMGLRNEMQQVTQIQAAQAQAEQANAMAQQARMMPPPGMQPRE